jgi:hypothetical protein
MTAISAQTVADIFGDVQQDADKGGGIGLGGRYITNSNSVTAFAEISGVKANNTSANYEGEMVFKTRVNGGNLTERMRIDGSGNVGIGTASPSWGIETGNFRGTDSPPSFNGTGDGLAVDVYNGGNPYPRYISFGALGSSTATAQFDFYADAGSSMVKSLSIKHDAVIVNENSADVDFRVESDANTHAFFVQGSSGKVGIGTSDPSNRMLKILQSSGDGSAEISTNDSSNAFLKFGTDSDGTERGGFVGIDYSDQVLRLNYGSGFDGTNNGLAIGASSATFAGQVSIATSATYGQATIGGSGEVLSLRSSSGASELHFYEGGTTRAVISTLNGSDGLSLKSGTTERMTIDSSGNVTVNSGSAIQFGDSSYKIIGSTAGNYLRFYTESTQALQIDDSQKATFAGNVKITKAESSASEFISALEINRDYGSATGTDLLTGMIFTDDNSVQAGIFTNRYNSAANYNSRLQFYVNNSSSSMTPQTALGDPALTINESKNAIFAGEIIYSSTANKLRTSTSDGSDNASIIIDSTGGGGSSTRGAYIALYGNEHANDGIIDIQTGNETASQINFRTGGGTARMVIDANSRISLSNNDSGAGNTIFGYNAGNAITTGHNNVVMGNNALLNSQDIGFAVAIGNSTMASGTMTADADGTVAVGHSSLTNLTSGAGNTAVGFESLKLNTTGDNNTAVGYQSLNSAGTSQNNVAVGYLALEELTFNGNSYNTAVGVNSGQELTTGIKNVFLGAFSGATTTDVDNSVMIGYNAGGAVMTSDADGTVAIGAFSLDALTSGGKNVALGYLTGSQITTGDSNIAIGHQAMDEISTGDRNIAIGHNAIGNAQGGANSGGSKDNIAIGFQSQGGGWSDVECLKNTSIGSYSLDGALNGALQNTAIGYASLGAVTQGDNNVAVGMEAGDNITTGTKNVTIGQQARTSAVGGNNQIVIGATTTGVADNSVTLGNADVTAVYMAQDSGASIFCGDIFSGRASSGSTGNGHSIRSADSAIFSRDAGGETVQVCRNADNGQFIQFRADGSIVGDIKNTGGTVSLTGFSGCHESSSSDTLEVGMVVSTIDAEHSENHAKVEISNSAGDKRVYGVVSDLEGLDGSNVTIASVGISSIKVTGSCVGGDLLESNGDGTAKVQSDDIIRSKTIGKVTMGNSTEEVKLVSCVLYCG